MTPSAATTFIGTDALCEFTKFALRFHIRIVEKVEDAPKCVSAVVTGVSKPHLVGTLLLLALGAWT